MKQSARSTAIKISLLILWAALFAAAAVWYQGLEIPLTGIPEAMQKAIVKSGHWGPLVYILAYTLRPLTLLPASIPSAAAGLLWGPFWGMIFTLIGENLSAGFAFYLARFLGQDWLIGFREHPLIKRVDTHLVENGVMTVLFLRLVFVPFDLLNFACGLTKMRYLDYAIGTAIGIVPGALIFVLFGSAWNEPRNLVISAILFAGSFVIAKAVKNSKLGHKLLELNGTEKA